ncbi:MAG: 30S ribosomal protein S7 [Candidatus Omnitrophica bacterium]|nr:30S ribosomal protein S7 [Candidatus Omnitrophota bacterium]
MPRRRKVIRKRVFSDPVYGDFEVAKFVNNLLKDGKKSLAYRIFYDMLDIIKERTKEDGLAVFKKAVSQVRPKLEVRPRRVGGATYQIPMEVPPARSLALAMRWILISARARKGKPMAERLADEIIEASRGEGASIKKREETHKMAESNRAFAHYRW